MDHGGSENLGLSPHSAGCGSSGEQEAMCVVLACTIIPVSTDWAILDKLIITLQYITSKVYCRPIEGHGYTGSRQMGHNHTFLGNFNYIEELMFHGGI